MRSVKKNKVKSAVRNFEGNVGRVPFYFFNAQRVKCNEFIKLFFINRLYFFRPVLLFKFRVPAVNGKKAKIRTPRKSFFDVLAGLHTNFSANGKAVVKNYF